ncbi:hypothetical protein GRI75_01875 [Altererythrobacter soli]|uniref:ABC-type glycine betaine transport system substrate-binding domain-containing protein n=1 Tax=Croceibacterium soli TaxID=1739690 RepID=A0A6I4US38_9SPHN|nr:hypothetical protein [Croceibacterium soli]MXP40393.1 hypothetical protein [Croceibacterium soli]
MARLVFAGALGILLAGCDLPRDPEGTESLVRSRQTIRLGWVSGARPDPAAQATLAKLSRKFGARVERHAGESEALLSELEEGRLDLVYGHFAESSPWATKVHLGEAEGAKKKPPKDRHAPRFAMRNGENGWIMAVARAGSGAAE